MTFGPVYLFPTEYSLSIVGCVLIATYCVGFLEYISDEMGNHANAHIGPPTKNVGTSKIILQLNLFQKDFLLNISIL